MDRERAIKDGSKSTLATQPANLPRFELHGCFLSLRSTNLQHPHMHLTLFLMLSRLRPIDACTDFQL